MESNREKSNDIFYDGVNYDSINYDVVFSKAFFAMTFSEYNGVYLSTSWLYC